MDKTKEELLELLVRLAEKIAIQHLQEGESYAFRAWPETLNAVAATKEDAAVEFLENFVARGGEG